MLQILLCFCQDWAKSYKYSSLYKNTVFWFPPYSFTFQFQYAFCPVVITCHSHMTATCSWLQNQTPTNFDWLKQVKFSNIHVILGRHLCYTMEIFTSRFTNMHKITEPSYLFIIIKTKNVDQSLTESSLTRLSLRCVTVFSMRLLKLALPAGFWHRSSPSIKQHTWPCPPRLSSSEVKPFVLHSMKKKISEVKPFTLYSMKNLWGETNCTALHEKSLWWNHSYCVVWKILGETIICTAQHEQFFEDKPSTFLALTLLLSVVKL